MYHAGNTLEKPVMWTITEHEDSIRFAELIAAEATPSLRNQCSLPGLFDGFKNQFGHSVGIIDNNGAEADIDRWGPCGQEVGKVGFGLIVRSEGEEVEARDGDIGTPVFGLGDQSWRPGEYVNLSSLRLFGPYLAMDEVYGKERAHQQYVYGMCSR